jgi:uncharacterized protein DUF4416
MGQPTLPAPVLPLLAVISRHTAALEWSLQRATQLWGPAALASETFSFAETDYYQPTMGDQLCKTFVCFQRLADPVGLADWKLATNAWEEEYARSAGHIEPRPLNLDPGYLTLAKLVLASTKDHAHRLYLRDGIYAEVTLYFKAGSWQHRDWTFPDYRRADYQQFFLQARDYLRQALGKHGLP